MDNQLARFIERTKWEQTGCIVWQREILPNGYGRFYVLTKLRALAHRWIYEYLIGPIPKGLQLDHLCRNRACVNPQHLEIVTLKENVRRGTGITARNAQKTKCKFGHPLSGENLYLVMREGGRSERRCRICVRRMKKKCYWKKYPNGRS